MKQQPLRRLIANLFCLMTATTLNAQPAGTANSSPPAAAPKAAANPAGSIDEIRARFARERRPLPRHGLYEDFAATNLALAPSGLRPAGVELGTNTPVRPFVPHLLAREATAASFQEAVTNGHFYVADDWLCDPTGFLYGAVNNQGVFTMGDEALMLGKTRLVAITPLAAKLRLLHEGALVHETLGTNLIFEAKEPGAYRLEAQLTVGTEDRPWIYSSPVVLTPPGLNELARLLELTKLSSDVKVEKGLTYRAGPEESADKLKLDLYLPKDKTNAPVFFFIHGGAWRTGDRSYYLPLGNRYAKEGFLTVAPSYRLAPKHPYPAQLQDTAAALAWTVRHIAEYGGDTNRIFVGGHSAGGHLAALLALDERALAAHQLSPKVIRGVLAFSGVYNLTAGEGLESVFGKAVAGRRAAAPLTYVRAGAPPFLVTYCEWDYFSLPAQAKEFHGALRQAGNRSELVYVPQESHISEMVSVTREQDPTVAAALRFIKGN